MKRKILPVVMSALLCVSSLAPVLPVNAAGEVTPPASIPAFPGAEGGGMFTSGGRGCEVYEVTTVTDYNPKSDAPIAGSLRDAISQDNRTIVFRVSGIINLKTDLSFSGRKNITVAGQTAPGDGICISGYGTYIDGADNIIVRYLRFRPGLPTDGAEPDSFGGRGSKNVMVDHISASWSTDETLSFYQNTNLTVQWSISSESLTLSGHFKGKHGYGGIWGGTNSTFHHNLMATHTSRNPRFGNGSEPGSTTAANNIIYNWAFNSSYGGGPDFPINLINNYYKPGPSTEQSVKKRILNPGDANSQYYVNGNYSDGNPDVTADNSLGIQEKAASVTISDTLYKNNSYTLLANQNNQTDPNKGVGIQDSQTAYKDILNKAGAVLPKRDSLDARVVEDVKNGTGRIINRAFEIGGLPEYASAEAPADSDHDGMPDSWEEAHKLDKNNAADGRTITASGYSNLEIYLNSLADMSIEPDNPVVKITNPTYNELLAAGSKMTIDVDATDKDGIEKVEFYRNDVKLGEDSEAPYSLTLENIDEGTWFISARAYDKKGNSTQSTSMPVFVNGSEVDGSWKSTDIGNTRLQGSGSFDASGTMTVKGAGKITSTSDSFHYVYQPVSGNATLTAKLDSIALVDNNAISGLMIRESLDPDAASAIISTSVVKAGRDEDNDNFKDDTYFGTFFSSRVNKGDSIKTLDWGEPQDYLPALVDCSLPLWLKIERVDNVIATYTSTDGTTWKELARKNFNMKNDVYIGFAVDATQSTQNDILYNTAKFSDIQLLDSFTVSNVKLTDIFGNEVGSLTSGLNAVAEVTVVKNSLAIEDAAIAVQLCDANGSVIGTSFIESEFNAGNTKTVTAGFSTPNDLEGISIKAFVLNNIEAGMRISNEVSVK